ncbi:MAG: tyrosine-type recombinase/integrase [Pseudomonadota bacterium]
MPLTDATLRKAQPKGKRFRKSDGNGLFVDMMPTGKKVFRLAYRFNGKQRTAVIGEYPLIKLADARLKAAKLKQSLRDGVDPNGNAESQPPEAPVPTEPIWRDVAQDYLMMRQRAGAATRTLTKLHRQVGVTVDHLGDRAVTSISAVDVLDVVNPIAEQGHVENAHEIRSRFSQIFRFAIARGLTQSDPAAVTVDAMIPRIRGEFHGLTRPSDIARLMKDIRAYRDENFWVGSALLLSTYLFPRNSEIRGMKWSEIDWAEKRWEVPSSRMKMKRDHIVPLPQSAIDVLRELKEIDVGSTLVFPSPRDPRRELSENTFNAALRRLGYSAKQHVHHGFRTTASTSLNEMGWNRDWIERQLAHVPENRVRSSYNKAEYLEGRTKMMGAYAEWLDNLAV